MGIWILIALFLNVARADCGDPSQLITQAEKRVMETRFDDAKIALESAEKAFYCGAIADPELLARMWITEGAMLSFSGDAASAEASFAAASRVAPDYWNQNFGPRLREQYQRAASHQTGSGLIRLNPPLVHYVGTLDGVVTSFPIEVSAGLHLVQVGEAGGSVKFAQVVVLTDKAALTISTGLIDPLEKTPRSSTSDAEPIVDNQRKGRKTRRKPTMLIVAGTAGLLAGGAAGLAYAQRSGLNSASSVEELQAARQRQMAFAVTSYSLIGVAATGFTLHFVL
jgi:hypothetical protein